MRPPSSRPGPVLLLGDVMTDVIVLPAGPPVRGSDRRATIRVVPGGSAANQALWLAAEGVAATLIARVGAADHHLLETRFAAAGVTPRFIADPVRPSGVLVTLLDPDGERSFLTDRGANLGLSEADLPPDALDGIVWLHLSGYAFFEDGPRAAALALIAEAGTRGIPFSVDPASIGFLEEIGPGRFLDWVEGAALVVPNADEAALLTGTDEPDRQLSALRRVAEVAVIKRGPAGAVAANARRNVAIPGAPVDAVDSTGAGDAFLAAFLARHLMAMPLAWCLAAAVAAGARAATVLGGQPRGGTVADW